MSSFQLNNLALEAKLSEWYEKDDVIMSAGETLSNNSRVFLIVSGRVRVAVSGKFVAYLETGKFFGEKGLIELKPRSATVIADGPLRLIAFTKLSFYKILRSPHSAEVFKDKMRTFTVDKNGDTKSVKSGETEQKQYKQVIRLAELKDHDSDQLVLSSQKKIGHALGQPEQQDSEFLKKFIVHPHSTFSHYWDMTMCFLLLYTAIVTAYEVAFIYETISVYKYAGVFILNRVVDIG
jgi:CRP-like cAMP-binding protein